MVANIDSDKVCSFTSYLNMILVKSQNTSPTENASILTEFVKYQSSLTFFSRIHSFIHFIHSFRGSVYILQAPL